MYSERDSVNPTACPTCAAPIAIVRPVVGTSATNKASNGRRLRGPKFSCQICSTSFTTNHNLKRRSHHKHAYPAPQCPLQIIFGLTSTIDGLLVMFVLRQRSWQNQTLLVIRRNRRNTLRGCGLHKALRRWYDYTLLHSIDSVNICILPTFHGVTPFSVPVFSSAARCASGIVRNRRLTGGLSNNDYSPLPSLRMNLDVKTD